MFCTNCGTQRDEGEEYCPHCGFEEEDVEADIPRRVVAKRLRSQAPQKRRRDLVVFCSNCGMQKEENELFCPDCGFSDEDGADAGRPRRTATRPRPQAAQNRLFEDSLKAIRQTLSVNPEEAVETAILSKENIWLILGGFYCLIMGVFMRVFFDGLITGTREFLLSFMEPRDFSELIVELGISWFYDLSFYLNRVFVLGLLSGAFEILLYGCAVMVLFRLFKIDILFTKVMNIVTSSMLVCCPIYIAAIIVGFFNLLAATGLFIIGGIAFCTVLYRGILKTADFKCSPLCVYCATLIVAWAIAIPVAGVLMGQVLPG